MKIIMRSLHSLCLFMILGVLLFNQPVLAQGSLEKIRVFGSALQSNLSQEDPDREVFVYLPPGYHDSDKRYPVVYFLHGYAVNAEVYVDGVLGLPASVDQAMASGKTEMILVMPDAFTRFGGSMYANSPTVGDWEAFVARDLVAHIDTNYRTLADRRGRGLSGHSMGGYGTLRIGMAYPEVFSAMYAMSACCLLNQAPDQAVSAREQQRMEEGIEVASRSFVNVIQAQAAAWAPNPQKPPYFFDLPFEDGEALPLVAEKWLANSLLLTVDQSVPALQQYRAIALDVGDEDSLETTNTQMAAALERLGIKHSYEVYAGDHGNRVGQRFAEQVLGFFSEHLQGE